jgi:hypothetical protein
MPPPLPTHLYFLIKKRAHAAVLDNGIISLLIDTKQSIFGDIHQAIRYTILNYKQYLTMKA